jgi:hypothetical protein
MIDKKANKQLLKGLKDKQSKPSWFRRHSRKKLIEKILLELKGYDIIHAWAHKDFVNAIEKKPSTIVIYVAFSSKAKEYANSIDGKMDSKFPKYHINIIDEKTLLPTIKTSVFNEVDAIL